MRPLVRKLYGFGTGIEFLPEVSPPIVVPLLLLEESLEESCYGCVRGVQVKGSNQKESADRLEVWVITVTPSTKIWSQQVPQKPQHADSDPVRPVRHFLCSVVS